MTDLEVIRLLMRLGEEVRQVTGIDLAALGADGTVITRTRYENGEMIVDVIDPENFYASPSE